MAKGGKSSAFARLGRRGSPAKIYNNRKQNNLRELAEDEELHPKSGASTPVRRPRIVTEVVADGHGRQVVDEVGKSPEHPDKTEGREGEIPAGHRVPPVPAGSRVEQELSQHDQETVQETPGHRNHRIRLHPVQDGDRIVLLLETAAQT